MTEPSQLRVFVNGTALFVPHGATALDAVRALDPALAEAVAAAERALTDSRGLPVAHGSAATGGAVYRIVSARALHDPGTM
jgi:hypothetical protein